MYRGYIFSVILVILSLLGITGLPSECFADNISSEVSIGSFYSIEEKLEIMSDSIKTEVWLDEKGCCVR